MREPLETAEIQAFARTVDARSLSRAAAELGMPRATLSRRLARLEGRLGMRLLRRTTRSLSLTDAGEAFYRHARIVLDAVGQAEESVRRSSNTICGDLRVSVPPMTNPSFLAMICEFAKQNPEVRLHVHFSTAHVDLQREGYDVAIRATMTLEPGLVARTLVRAPVIAVASPGYLAERGTPRTPRDLRNHRCILGFARGELPQTHWGLASGGKVRVEGAFFSNEVNLLCDAAVRGLGIAFLPLMIIGQALESGALFHVLAGTVEAKTQVAVVYPEREFVPPQVRAFVDAVVAWAPGQLGSEVPPCPPQSGKRATRPSRATRRTRL